MRQWSNDCQHYLFPRANIKFRLTFLCFFLLLLLFIPFFTEKQWLNQQIIEECWNQIVLRFNLNAHSIFKHFVLQRIENYINIFGDVIVRRRPERRSIHTTSVTSVTSVKFLAFSFSVFFLFFNIIFILFCTENPSSRVFMLLCARTSAYVFLRQFKKTISQSLFFNVMPDLARKSSTFAS